MLKVENLAFSYGDKEVFSNLNLEFEKGKMYAIKGRSGCGKTTLLSILGGLEKNYSGDMYFEGEKIEKNKLFDYRFENVSIIFQNLNLIEYLTIKENISEEYRVKNKDKIDESKLMKLVKDFDLGTINIDDFPKNLSGGQQQRIAIMRTIMSNSNIILADEPTASLDAENRNIILGKLKELAEKFGIIVIVVTHDSSVAKMSDEIIDLVKMKK